MLMSTPWKIPAQTYQENYPDDCSNPTWFFVSNPNLIFTEAKKIFIQNNLLSSRHITELLVTCKNLKQIRKKNTNLGHREHHEANLHYLEPDPELSMCSQ